MNLKAQDGVFRRKENDVDFTKDVKLTRGRRPRRRRSHARPLRADRKTLVAWKGRARLHRRSAARAGPGRRPRRTQRRSPATASAARSAPDGQISALNFIGDTGLAHAVIEGPPNRDLVAHTFRVGTREQAGHRDEGRRGRW